MSLFTGFFQKLAALFRAKELCPCCGQSLECESGPSFDVYSCGCGYARTETDSGVIV